MGGSIFWDVNVGDVAGFIGLVYAIIQVHRTMSSANAAKNAIRSASATSRTYHFLLLAPQLEKCEAQIESAAFQNDRNQLLDRSREWKNASAEITVLLDDYPDEKVEVEKAIGDALSLLGPMKKKVTRSDGSDLIKHTERFREAASDAVSKVVALATRVRTNLENPVIDDSR